MAATIDPAAPVTHADFEELAAQVQDLYATLTGAKPADPDRPPQWWLDMNEEARRGLVPEDRVKALASLWKPTPEEYVSKLSRYVGSKDVPKNQRDRHQCSECNAYHEFPAIHLDYCGHADTCRMIAEVDPAFGWYPKAGFDEYGEPHFVRDNTGYPIRLWIWLDVLGVVRAGVGTVERGKSDPEKELIGDAIRNAAMRFGVAADLWSKAKGAEADVDSTEGGYQQRAQQPSSSRKRPSAQQPPADQGESEGADWASRNGWQSKEHLDTERQLVRETLRKLLADEKVTEEKAGAMWHEYQRSPSTGDVGPRTREEHEEWWNRAARPLLDSKPATEADPGKAAWDSGELFRSVDDPAVELPRPSLEQIIEQVKRLETAELTDLLRARGLSVAGNVDAKRKRLAVDLYERSGEGHQAAAEPETEASPESPEAQSEQQSTSDGEADGGSPSPTEGEA